VVLAVRLVVVVVFEVLEVQEQGVVEGVICDRALGGGGGLAHEAMHQVGNLLELDQLVFEGGALFRGEVLFQPEVDVVKHGVCVDKGSGQQVAPGEFSEFEA